MEALICRKRNWGSDFFCVRHVTLCSHLIGPISFEISDSKLWSVTMAMNAAKSQATFMEPKTQDWCKLN